MNSGDSIVDKCFEDGLLIITGARDKYGNHLVTIPVNQVVLLENIDARYLFSSLQKILSWQYLIFNNTPGIALLLNLKHARKIVIQLITDVLSIIQAKKWNGIQIVYIIKPDTRTKSHLLKKLLGINARMYQIQLFKNVDLLRNHVETNQLTQDYGGILYHDYRAWLMFYKKVQPCLNSAKELFIHLPGIKDKVELWEEYETCDLSAEQLQQTLTNIAEQFHSVIKEVKIGDVIEECKQMLHTLESTDGNYAVDGVDMSLTSPAILMLRKRYQELSKFQQDLLVLYQSTEKRITYSHQLQKCKEKADKIVSLIKETFISQLTDHPAVGLTLSQAEVYRTHFTSSLYEPSKNLLSDATDILEELKRYTESDIRTSIANLLTSTIEPFTLQLQKIYHNYIAIHVFHTLLNKFLKWYKKVLNFLPDYLGSQYDEMSPNKLVYMPDEWIHTVDTFLTKHPSPREDHIIKLDLDIPALLPRQLKQKAHCVAIRTRLLQRLLTSRRLPVKLIIAAFKWKKELQGTVSSVKSKPLIKINAPSISSLSNEDDINKRKTKERSKPRSPRRKTFPREDLEISTEQPKQMEEHQPELTAEKERFIRVTFTPKDVLGDTGDANRRFSFGDVIKDATGSESGIEVVDTDDPYDIIINKIKEVSNSQLSSDLKLKYVTNLLRYSLHDAKAHKPRYVKNPMRTRRYSRLKSTYGKSVGNLLDFEEPTMTSFHSLQNLHEINDGDAEMSFSPSRSNLFITSLQPTNSLHNLDSEMQLSPMATDISKWYQDYDSTPHLRMEDPTEDRLQHDLDKLHKCQTQRLAEQNILEREKQRLDEIDMEAELFKQDGVEISLRRSHNILQEEEVRLGSEVNDNEESGFFREALFQENYEDLMPQLAVGRRPKSDLGYDSVSSPATNRRTTVSGSKTSYEEPDLQEEPQSSIISQAPMTDQSTKLFKAREALGSILPKFSSTVEIDQFCVQLRNKRLNTHKTVADAYTRDTYMLDQPSTSNNEENTTFLDTNNYY